MSANDLMSSLESSHQRVQDTDHLPLADSGEDIQLQHPSLPIEFYLERKQSLQQIYENWVETRLRNLSNLDALGSVLGIDAPNRVVSFCQGQAIMTVIVPSSHRRTLPFDKGLIGETLEVLNDDWCLTNRLYEDMWAMLDPGETICMNFGRSANKYTRVHLADECGQQNGHKAYVLMYEFPFEPQAIGYLLSDLQLSFRPGHSFEYDWEPVRIDTRFFEQEYHTLMVAYNIIAEELDAIIQGFRDKMDLENNRRNTKTPSDLLEVAGPDGDGSRDDVTSGEINDNIIHEVSPKQEPKDNDSEDSKDSVSPSMDSSDIGWMGNVRPLTKLILPCFVLAFVALFCWGGISNQRQFSPFSLNSVLVATVLCLAVTLGLYRGRISTNCQKWFVPYWNKW